MCKGQGRKPILDARDLRALKRHCIKNRHDSVTEITAWAQDHFRKSLSVNTVRRAIHKCKLKLYHAKKKPYVNTIQKHRRLRPVPTFLRRVAAIKFKMVQFLNLNILYVFYVLFWIKYGFMRFANHCILFLFTFYKASQLFWNWACIIKPFEGFEELPAFVSGRAGNN